MFELAENDVRLTRWVIGQATYTLGWSQERFHVAKHPDLSHDELVRLHRGAGWWVEVA